MPSEKKMSRRGFFKIFSNFTKFGVLDNGAKQFRKIFNIFMTFKFFSRFFNFVVIGFT